MHKPSGVRTESVPDPRWHVSLLAHAPHRLSFFLAMLVLMASGIWWALVQMDRSLFASSTLVYAMPAMLTRSVVMCFGFLPPFFAGFLFTAARNGCTWKRPR